MNNIIHVHQCVSTIPIKRNGELWNKSVKYIIAMKLMLLILTISLQVSAVTDVHSQQITLSVRNAPLRSVLQEIRKQSGYAFIAQSDQFVNAKPVSLTIKNLPIAEALQKIFAGQPLTYKLENKGIIVYSTTETEQATKPATVKPNPIPQPKPAPDYIELTNIKGTVTDKDGQPLEGATVILVGQANKGATTNEKGEFYLPNVPETGKLLVRMIGYGTEEIRYTAGVVLKISLSAIKSDLDEIQIIAYGQTSRRLSTGNISSVKAKDIETQPVNNPLLALTGRVPGLFITQSNGLPGTGVTVRIQGRNSIDKGNDPFYVIDGVPYTSQVLPTLGAGNLLGSSGGEYLGSVTGSGNPLNFINPADIESIDILKDADATAIYGSRAANGAILITTKKAAAGQTAVNVTFQTGIGRVPKKMKLLNTQQYLEMRREAYKNDGLSVPTPTLSVTQKNSTNYDFTVWDTTRYTDWQKELIGGSATYTDLQASISGGNQQTSFRINGGYHWETTVFPGDFSDVKGSLGVNINHSSTNQKFKMAFSATYLQDNSQLPTRDFTFDAMLLSPNAPALYTTNGQLNWQRIAQGVDSVSTWTNPLSYLEAKYLKETNNLIGGLDLSYRIINGLEAKINLGYTNTSTIEIAPGPLTRLAPELRSRAIRRTGFGNGQIKAWIAEPQLNYHVQLRNSILDILVGSTFQKNTNNLQQINASGFNSDLVLKDIKAASSTTVGQTVLSTYKYTALFGRITYNLSNKYIVNLTARRDGSSRFGSNNRFHNFGAIGAAWLFSQESFIKDHIAFLSFGKLRASYGTSGNDQIGDYQFLSLYAPITYDNQYQGAIGLQSTGLTNPYIQWELTKKLQAGIDMGFIQDRILVNANYYYNTSSNQLLYYSLPIATGFTGIYRNFPATVANLGWEFAINTINVQKKCLNWSTSFNITIPKNRLKKFPNLSSSSYNLLVIGESIATARLYKFAGVNTETGKYQYMGADGVVTSSPISLTDQTVLFNPDPKWYGGLQNSLSFKGFTLDALFQFVEQKARDYTFGLTNAVGRGTLNQNTAVLNRWQQEGDHNKVQKFSSLSNFSIDNRLASNAAISDASYIRLKNLSFSWNMPPAWLKTSSLAKGRIFIQGQNLLTFTKYNGLDPESLSISSLPPLKVWTLGIQLTL
jgi:TonB-linked SusC/RagA family outer membrane protein